MDKKKIKDFAIWSRKKLIREITYKASLIGVTEERIIEPNLASRDVRVDIGVNEEHVLDSQTLRQRNSLIKRIEEKEKTSDYKTAFRYVIEEVAYTWFNRLIAIRFMEVNEYLPSQVRVLSSAIAGKKEPDLVTNPFDSDIEFKEQERVLILRLKEENKLDELFRMLFIMQCNKLNEVLPELFEKTDDYTEYLLHISFVDEDGVVSHLVNDIEEDDFKEAVEIIGWMYQYYNTEPKDEVFALLKKNVKITKERLPAATQLFTPKWIVKYMVENSLGRLWLEGHSDDELKGNWKYYLDEAEQEEQVKLELEKIRQEYKLIVPEQIKVIDPCMGSGHILIYVFEVLLQIYESQGYTKRDAVASIVKNNLFGLDIDERAYQLSYFAIKMMATKYDRRFLTRTILPNVYAIAESNEINRDLLQYFGTTLNQKDRVLAQEQVDYLLDAFVDAKEYGSILNVNGCDWKLLERFIEDMKVHSQISMDDLNIEGIQSDLKKIARIGELLANKFDVVVTNPPYMGLIGGNGKINEYARKYYPNSKSDMFAIFIEKCMQLTDKNKYMAMITQHSWMFLSSFEKLRVKLLENDIINMAHLGARAFDEISGEVVQVTSWVHRIGSVRDYKATYLRLVDFKSQNDKELAFIQCAEKADSDHVELLFKHKKDILLKIPGMPIAYWLSKGFVEVFRKGKPLKEFSIIFEGLKTRDKERFIRLWHEVADKKWRTYAKGGEFRRWYGNLDYVVKWGDSGDEIRDFKKSSGTNFLHFNVPTITYSAVTSYKFSGRYINNSFFGGGGGGIICKSKLLYQLGLINSTVFYYMISSISPTMNYEVGQIASQPMIVREDFELVISEIVKKCIYISRVDWDSHETSQNFSQHPLLK